MVPRRRSATRPLKDVQELGNEARNERQKAMLLRELGKTRRDEVCAAVETSKRIVEESKRLCRRQEERPAGRPKG